ncbi:3-methylornithyl-N6-L-lysine dehydrogenase PylD [Desulfosarcina sp.]|uniref:3-methylornithyl-N6-L-lysine dehydrogenase PylD n=1 Tax=Desulfosarcina sp. TaxID=2027861 RepID=UPI003568FFFD
MTRLTTQDIQDIRYQLNRYDRYLVSATGRSLLGIGAAAAGIGDVTRLRGAAPSIRMAVVPIRSGLGIISGFAETVCGILVHLGFDAFVTGYSDVSGFAEAVDAGAQVILAADDDRFVAFCPRQGKTVDNSRATAAGFVAGLDLMAGGLDGKDVLVIGCGPVGRWSVESLLMRKARVSVVDRVAQKAADLAGWVQGAFHSTIRVAPDPDTALSTHRLIVEATNAAEVIHARHVNADTRVSAPGMPCGLTPHAREKLTGRMLHDPLPIGVAAMASQAVRIIREQPMGLKSTASDGRSE